MANERKHISLRTKLASALLALGEIPYEDAKKITEGQLLSLYQFDHNILHAIESCNDYWNLTPRLIRPHRAKSKVDVGKIAKVKRIDVKWEPFMNMIATGRKPPKKQSRWPKRSLNQKFSSRRK